MLKVFILICIFSVLFSLPAEAQLPGGAFSNPTFDCTKVSSPLPVTICSSEAAAQADWELSSAFWALYSLMGDADRQAFVRAQDDWFRSLVQLCNLQNSSDGSGTRPSGAQSSCVATLYRGRAADYRAKLSGDSLAEASLTPQRHKQIQDALISLGLLTGRAEGLFGPQTRRAIRQFQTSHSFPPTGFLSSSQRRMLIGEEEAAPVPKATAFASPPGSEARPDSLQEVKARNTDGKLAKEEAASPAEIANPSVQSGGSEPQKAAVDEPAKKNASDAQAIEADKSLCEKVGSNESAAACSRLIANGIAEGVALARLVLNRAKTNEALNRDELALEDYTAAYLLSPDSAAASAGKARTEKKIRAQEGSPTSSQEPNSQRHLGAEKDSALPKWLRTNRYPLILATLLFACTIFIFIMARSGQSTFTGRSYGRVLTPKVRRLAGASVSLSILATACGYLVLGNARSTAAVAQIAQHIPLTSQAYFVVPHFGVTLEATKRLLSEAATSIDVDRLAKATRGSVRDIRINLARFQSTVPMPIADGEYVAANGCLDFAETLDRSRIGLTSATSAAAFVGRESDALPIFAIGPVDKSRLSAFLSNATSRFMLDFSTNGPVQSDGIKLNIEQWQGKDLRLCSMKTQVAKLQAGSILEVSSAHPHAIATIDSTSAIPEDADFSIRCSYEESGQKRNCRCEVWERQSDGVLPIHLGDCETIGKAFGKHTSAQRELTKAISEGGVLRGPITFDIPLIGRMGTSNDISVKWMDNILVVGEAKVLERSAVGTADAARSSVVRDDSFVNQFRRTATKATGFFGLARPDWYPASASFNRLISVPMNFRGAVEDKAVELHASLNFEPLDAAILQDMSRSYSGAEGEVPIDSSIGSASLRIGDDKVSQYINFADQFILNRLIQGLSSLDTEDPITNIRADFIRFILRKLGLRDGTSSIREDSFANQPHQIIVLDDPPGSWAPSIAVAVKFQSLDAAYTFLCAEPSRLRQTIDGRILLNSARAAKQETKARVPRDPEEYRSLLQTMMAASLEDGSWDRYRARYDIDPVFMIVKSNVDTESSDNGRCDPTLSDELIDGRTRKIYYLSPSIDENMKRFYYQLDALPHAAELRAQKLDPAIADLAGTLKELPVALTALLGAKHSLAACLDEAKKKTGPTSPLLKSLGLKLQRELEDGGVDPTVREWSTAEEAQEELANPSLSESIERKIIEIRDSEPTIRDSLAAKRIQRAIAASEGDRISRELSRGGQRIVAYLDEGRRLLFIANDIGTLKRAAEQADLSRKRGAIFDDSTDERIRFYASGDNAVQSVLDVMPVGRASDLPLLWRSAKLGGSVLPFEAASAGVSGQTSGIMVSLTLALPKRVLK